MVQSGLDLWSGMAGNTPEGGICWFRAESADRLLLFYQDIGSGRNHASTEVKQPTDRHAQNDRRNLGFVHMFSLNTSICDGILQSNSCFHGKPPLPKLCMVASLHHVFMSHSNQGTVDRMLGHGTGHNSITGYGDPTVALLWPYCSINAPFAAGKARV